jgi:hypothetical protein
LPGRRTFNRVRNLYDRAVDVVSQRRLVLTKVSSSRPEHADCHRRAIQRLRQEIVSDSALAWQFALGKEEQRLESLFKERATLQRRLDAIEEEAVLIRVRMAALSHKCPAQAERPGLSISSVSKQDAHEIETQNGYHLSA